jgi:hypothetical protein
VEKLLEKFEDKKNHQPFLNCDTVDELLDNAKPAKEKPSADENKQKNKK